MIRTNLFQKTALSITWEHNGMLLVLKMQESFVSWSEQDLDKFGGYFGVSNALKLFNWFGLTTVLIKVPLRCKA